MLPLLLPLHLTLLVTGAIATLVGASLVWPRRSQPGGITLLVLLAAIAEWQLCSALGTAALTLPAKRAWAQVQYLGIVSVAPLWLQFILRYLGHTRGTGWRAIAATAVIPLVTLAAAATSASHAWLWTSIELLETPDGVRAAFHHGPVFWLAAAYSYALLAGATVFLLRVPRATQHVDIRPQRGLLLLGGTVPWLANVLYLTGTLGAHGIDPTPIAFGVTGICAAIALADFGLLDLPPSRIWRSRPG